MSTGRKVVSNPFLARCDSVQRRMVLDAGCHDVTALLRPPPHTLMATLDDSDPPDVNTTSSGSPQAESLSSLAFRACLASPMSECSTDSEVLGHVGHHGLDHFRSHRSSGCIIHVYPLHGRSLPPAIDQTRLPYVVSVNACSAIPSFQRCAATGESLQNLSVFYISMISLCRRGVKRLPQTHDSDMPPLTGLSVSFLSQAANSSATCVHSRYLKANRRPCRPAGPAVCCST